MLQISWLFLSCWLLLVCSVFGVSNSIDSTGSFNCAADADNAVIKVTRFTFTFDRATSSVYYSATGTSSKTVNATAKISLIVYGEKVATREVKFCQYGVTELCPVPHDTDVTITGNHSVPVQYVSGISDLAFTIPDLEGNIFIELYDVNDVDEKNQLGCFRSDITNGNSTEVASAKWGTAVAAIVALVVAMGSSAASQAGGVTPVTDGGAAHAATAGVTGTEVNGAHGAAGATGAEANTAPASGPGTNVAQGGFHAPGLMVLVNWLQTMSVNGVYSVDYPKVYRSFTRNFSWTCGILEFKGLEPAIDKMRNHTGGNLTESSYKTLESTTLYEDPLSVNGMGALSSLQRSDSSNTKRLWDSGKMLVKRYDTENGFFTITKRATNSTSPIGGAGGVVVTAYSKYVNGMEAYLEKNHIPKSNAFCTLLIWWCIILLCVVAVILLFKIGLEFYYTEKRMEQMRQKWVEYEHLLTTLGATDGSSESSKEKPKHISRGSALLTRLSLKTIHSKPISLSSSSSQFPKPPPKPKFQEFRKNYRNFLRITIIRVIVILYGAWVLLSLYQFRIGDSWASILLAALTFSIFTLILVAYAIRIWYLAYIASKRKIEDARDTESDTGSVVSGAESLFTHKPWINKYGVFYDEFKVKFWWFFIPSFVAVFGRNAFIGLGVGHPLIQIFGQLAIDVCLCAFFCVFTPFNTKMGNGLNIVIQVVRVVSLLLTFLFTDVVSLNKIKSTAVGFVLIALQASLTVLLVILIIINAFKGMFSGFIRSQKQKRIDRKQSNLIEKEDDNHRLSSSPHDDMMITGRDSIQLINLDSPTGSFIDHEDLLGDDDDSGPHSSFDKMMNAGIVRENQEGMFVENFGPHYNDLENVFGDHAAIKSQKSQKSEKSRISNPFDSKNAVDSSSEEGKANSNEHDDFHFVDATENNQEPINPNDEDMNTQSFRLYDHKYHDDEDDINDDLRMFKKM